MMVHGLAKGIFLAVAGAFLCGCAQDPHLVYLFPPHDIERPLVALPVTPRQNIYTVHFTPRYPVLYDVKLRTCDRPQPYEAGPPIVCLTRVYREGVLIGVCESTVHAGWWGAPTDTGFHFCAMDSLPMRQTVTRFSDKWTYLDPRFGDHFLVPGRDYKIVLTMKGDLRRFIRDFGPVTLEISKSMQNNPGM